MAVYTESSKKIQRFIHNQVLSPPAASQLSFSRTNLLPSHRCFSTVLIQCQLHSAFISSLDCHFCILNKSSISTLCKCLVNLEELKIVDCGLRELDHSTALPERLKCVDLSRNQLTQCPQGLTSLLYLTTLNLSGNLIQHLDPLLLRLPLLEKFHFIHNPVQNVPKHICREGVVIMREYFKTVILPKPPPESIPVNSSLSVTRKSSSSVCDSRRCHDLRRYMYLLDQQSSFDSGYESSQRCRSSSVSSIDTCDSDGATESSSLPSFEQFQLPSGYATAAESNVCLVFLPEGCKDEVNIELVKDISLYPKVDSNELLITPVVQISPHGRHFSTEQPAIVALPHCTKLEGGGNGSGSKQQLVPLYSDSCLGQPTAWGKLDGDCDCQMFRDHVLFKTTHFSLFAVISVLPYPTASISIGPDHGGLLVIPELPGFEVSLPPTLTEKVTVTATVYYDDAPYSKEDTEHAPASPCIGLEPHGAQFVTPVQVTLPIPNYAEIMRHFPNAELKLWHAQAVLSHPQEWEQVDNSSISVEERRGQYVLVFKTTHFSWWETLWDIGRRALQRVGLGSSVDNSRTRYVSVRIQAFMSPPVRLGRETHTFGLLVTVYKFGTPLSQLSNYPWSLLDTGSKRIYLRLGPLEVSIQGCFSALEYEDPTCPLSRSAELIEFNGDDFCQRFEFALQLRPGCELLEGVLMGKLRFKQWSGSTPHHHNYNLIVKYGPIATRQPGPMSQVPPLTPSNPDPPLLYNSDFTPPWSPESDTQMMDAEEEEEEVFLNKPSTSASVLHLENSLPKLPRKRPLNLANAPGHESGSIGAKRRLLCRHGDIDERMLLSIADAVGSKYTELGVELSVPYKWIQSNVENRPGMSKDNLKAMRVLDEWKSRAGEKFTYSELARALETDIVGLRSVAAKFCYSTS